MVLGSREGFLMQWRKYGVARFATALMTLAFVAACGGEDGGGPPASPDAGGVETDAGGGGEPDGGVVPETDGPLLLSVIPASGGLEGGTRVVLRGQRFRAPVDVAFGGQPATQVVLLDEFSVAATTPPGAAAGSVDVAVAMDSGTSELAAGFRYHRTLRVDRVVPDRVSARGGTPIRIEGVGFDDDTLFLLDRQPVRGLRVIDDRTAEGYAPPTAAGHPELRAVQAEAQWRGAGLVRAEGVPEAEAMVPATGPAGAAFTVEVHGRDLDEVTEIYLGGVEVTDWTRVAPDRLSMRTPALGEGRHALVLRSPVHEDTWPDAYGAMGAGDLAVLGVLGGRQSVTPDRWLTLAGRGFAEGMEVWVSGQPAEVGAVAATEVQIRVGEVLPRGEHGVRVRVAGREAERSGALLAADPLFVAGVQPGVADPYAPTALTIIGAGFEAGVDVRVGGVALEDVQVDGDGTVRGELPAGSHGRFDVVVRRGRDRARLPDAVQFREDFQVIRVEPADGSIAGGTYVSVFGRGLDADASVTLAGDAVEEATWENGAVFGFRAPPSFSQTVDLSLAQGTGEATIPGAFRYYNPRLVTGGGWGGVIEGAVHVAVQDFQGQPLPGVAVQLGYDADPNYRAFTDERGLATISSPEIRGPQTVTVGAEGYEFVTFQEVEARNLTFFSSAHPANPPPDQPVPPCPEPQAPPVVTGKGLRLKSALDSVTRPGWRPAVRITYAQRDVFTPNQPDPPGLSPSQVAWVFDNDTPYAISVLRPGPVAVYGIFGDLSEDGATFVPRRMGIARSVAVGASGVVEDAHIDFNIPLDQQTVIRLDNAPEHQPGPSVNVVFPFLNLGSDGVVPFDPAVVQGQAEVLVSNLPNIAESQFVYMGGSFTLGEQGLTAPYSLSVLESGARFEDGVDLGPFLSMPIDVRPKAGALAAGREIGWTQPGIRPDLTTVSIGDSAFVCSACCLDANGNGACEEGEPQMGGCLPQPFTRWSLFGQGGAESYPLPAMPPSVQAFATPNVYGWQANQALSPRFTFREFVYSQFSPYFWRSWAVSGSSFLVKEETD